MLRRKIGSLGSVKLLLPQTGEKCCGCSVVARFHMKGVPTAPGSSEHEASKVLTFMLLNIGWLNSISNKREVVIFGEVWDRRLNPINNTAFDGSSKFWGAVATHRSSDHVEITVVSNGFLTETQISEIGNNLGHIFEGKRDILLEEKKSTRKIPAKKLDKVSEDVNKIIMVVSSYYDVDAPLVLEASRKHSLRPALHMAIYVMQERLGMTPCTIGKVFGRHIVSIKYTLGAFADRLDTFSELQSELCEVTALLDSSDE